MRPAYNILFLLFLTFSVPAQIRLPQLVRDSMILQRDTRLRIWGWASEGEKIKITFNRKTVPATAGPDGKWVAWLPPVKAGGPYTMQIVGKNKILLKEILIGDVWFCSGQSNMVHQMALHNITYAKEIADANEPGIRHFRIPTLTNLQHPEDDLPTGYWKWANPQDVNQFSAVAYFFAKKIYEKFHVPIGLINASVGGTPIEAWTSEEGLKDFSSIQNTIEKNKDTAYVNNTNRTALAARPARAEQDQGLKSNVKWFDVNYTLKGWQTINVPGYWEDQGIKELNGVVWYRKEIDIPKSMTGVPARVFLGRIVDADILYINGEQAGSTAYQYPQRRYSLTAGTLKPGKNVFIVRVTNNAGKGGFVPDKPYYVEAAGKQLDIKGTWLYKVGDVYPLTTDGFAGGVSAQNSPTALYNAMVAPVTNYAIKGILWYQGESNAGHPAEYEKLLPALIQDWRKKWNDPNIPFLYVQLPNFMEAQYHPSESNWAILREAALKTLSVPNAAMAVSIDLGEWNDIHPENKKDVGERLALAARKLAYGEKGLIASGPLYQSATIDGEKIIVSFTNTGSGLITNNGEAPGYFSIAGSDKKFVWAEAKIEGNKVIVSSNGVDHPLYVRYAWADNPFGANLYNAEGLPASPFRTDK